ncbi:hypothetical protein GVAV_003366 [Gurleya vavrai]
MHDEEVIAYTNRLASSQYVEDKLKALQNLLRISKQFILPVAVHSMVEVIKSIESTFETNIQKQILHKIFKSQHKNEFLEILLMNDDCVYILIKNFKDFDDLLYLLAKKNGRVLFDILAKRNELYLITNNLVYFVKIIKYLVFENNRQILCFEGCFEKILEIVNDQNCNDCIDALKALLDDCINNQKYFLELKWKDKICKYKPFKLYITLLDQRNINFKFVQNFFCNKEFIDLLQYEFIRLIIYNNVKNFIFIEEMGFDIYKTCLNLELEYTDKIKLLEEVCKYKEIDLNLFYEKNKYFYGILTVLYLQENENAKNFIKNEDWQNEFLFNLYKLKKNHRQDNLIFLVLFSVIKEELNLDNYLMIIKENIYLFSDWIKSFLFFIISEEIYKNSIFNISYNEIIFEIQKMQIFLCNESFGITDKTREFLLCKIQDLLIYFFEKDYKNEYTILKIENDKKNEIIKEEIKEIKIIDTERNFKKVSEPVKIEEVAFTRKQYYNEKITGFFSRFKFKQNEITKKENEDTNYDL